MAKSCLPALLQLDLYNVLTCAFVGFLRLTNQLLTVLKTACIAGAEQQESDNEGCTRRLKQLYTELAEIDPKRKGYYDDALAGKASVLVQQRT